MIESGPAENTLIVYLWLPAGKDAFGVEGWGAHDKINPLIKKKIGWEAPIGINFLEKMKNDSVKIPHQIRSCYTNFSEIMPNLEFASRGISSNFLYYSKEINCTAPATFRLWSVGVYAWIFNIPAKYNIDRSLTNRFVTDFFENHIIGLFDGGWSKGSITKPRQEQFDEYEDSYKGILNFNQIEMLFDAIFNYKMSPHSFFRQSPKDEGGEISVKLQDIIERIMIIGGKNFAYPYNEVNKTYLKKHNDTVLYQNLTNFITERADKKTNYRTKIQSEYVLARLVYSSMEQFVRVSVIHGGALYREGMSFIRTQLVEYIFSQKIDRKTRRVLGRSWREISNNSTSTQIEVYFCLVEANFSALQYLFQMINDINEIVNFNEHEKKEYDRDSADENNIDNMEYSRDMLRESLMQFQKLNDVIYGDIQFVRDILSREKSYMQISQLSELRRIQELDWERRSSIDSQNDSARTSMMSHQFTVIAGIIAFIAIIIQISWSVIDNSKTISENIYNSLEYIFNISKYIDHNSAIMAIILILICIAAFPLIESISVLSYICLVSSSKWDVNNLIDKFNNKFIIYLIRRLFSWRKKIPEENNSTETPDNLLEKKSFNVVVDCSSLHQQIGDGDKPSDELIRDKILVWQKDLIEIFGTSEDRIKCKEHHASFDNIATNIQKIKFSFRSDKINAPKHHNQRYRSEHLSGFNSDTKIKYEYTLHVEYERHISTDQIYLTDFRVFVGGIITGNNSVIDFNKLIKQGVEQYISEITGANEATLKEMMSRFGYRANIKKN